MIQLFDSWAHHLSPEQFAEFSLPYMERVTKALKAKYPHVPVIMHANGGKCWGGHTRSLAGLCFCCSVAVGSESTMLIVDLHTGWHQRLQNVLRLFVMWSTQNRL